MASSFNGGVQGNSPPESVFSPTFRANNLKGLNETKQNVLNGTFLDESFNRRAVLRVQLGIVRYELQ